MAKVPGHCTKPNMEGMEITMKMDFRRYIYLLVATTTLTLMMSVSLAAPPPKVAWSSNHLELKATRGGYTEREIQFSVTRDVGPVMIDATPSLQDIVSLEPARFDHLEAGQLYSTRLILAPSDDAKERIYGGTIRLRHAAATIPATLKTKIRVEGDSSDSYISNGVVTLEGASETNFNPTSGILSFSLSEAAYTSNSTEIQLYHQGMPVPDSFLTIAPNSITVEPILTSGRNELLLAANDTEGKLVYEEYVLWAGNRTLQGSVLDQYGQAVNDASVIIKLGDDAEVTATAVASGGQFSFSNLPPRTVILESVADGGLAGSVAANGGQGFVSLPVIGFYPPSDVDNNDFSQDLAGWEIGNAPVTLQPHEPETQDQLAISSLKESSVAAASDTSTANNRQETHDRLSRDLLGVSGSGAVGLMAIDQQDMDLALSTSGEGSQTISRSFNTTPGVRNVQVRYRFITTEVPGGYYGTQFNDYFSVNVRSASGGSVNESNSMNGMGLGAFDGSGRTAWREQTLTVDPQGETVQVDVTVANVADGWLDSYVVIDLVEEQNLAITSLQINDIDDSALEFLSASPHTYFAGNTRIHGSITVEGSEDDTLSSLELEVIQNGAVVATGGLDAGAQGTLLQSFGEDNIVEIENSQLLFNLNPTGIDSTANGTLSLRVKAESQNGEEVTEEAGSVQILRQVQGVPRYGQRDVTEGGDDWAKPSVADLVEQYNGLTWGDFSNMNAGDFLPHTSHRSGNDGDGWFAGYNAIDAATAATIVDHLNEPDGSRITLVFVTYQAQEGNAFYDAISDVTLTDGRAAVDVIRPVAGHSTHYHWRVAD